MATVADVNGNAALSSIICHRKSPGAQKCRTEASLEDWMASIALKVVRGLIEISNARSNEIEHGLKIKQESKHVILAMLAKNGPIGVNHNGGIPNCILIFLVPFKNGRDNDELVIGGKLVQNSQKEGTYCFQSLPFEEIVWSRRSWRPRRTAARAPSLGCKRQTAWLIN